MITKNFLITRDIDILEKLAAFNLVNVFISITSLDDELIRKMEPRTAAPYKRLEAIRLLSSNGIPTGVNVAPIIPGLNDEEIPTILKEAAAHGATSAGRVMLRLPGPVQQLFVDWLERELPDRAPKILNRIRDIRGGNLNDPKWGSRFRGEGEIAEAIKNLFHLSCEKYGLNKEDSYITTEHFRREPKLQLEMFG
jgi:DNA repair photolyase